MKYKNPIITGCYPDPSICRVGEDFFLVNSSFEYFPGIPVFHSKDLVNWEQIGHCISRNSQLYLTVKGHNNTGIFAPSIRYHAGVFYVITTNLTCGEAGGGNFYVWTKNPYGEWSEPVFLDTPGIDPSLFFDEDGTCYYIGTNGDIYIRQLDVGTGQFCGEHKPVWTGSGGSYPEGPHLYKKDGWYYLLISEGGTERCHMITMARSKCIEGPYEECPYNPVLTNRSLNRPIEAVGHADLVQDQHGKWWAVCLGNRPVSYPQRHNLGRETMLAPVDFSGEWPVFGNNGVLEEEFEVLMLPGKVKENKNKEVFEDYFDAEELHLSWNFKGNPDDSLWDCGNGALKLYGNDKKLSDAAVTAWVGRRQKHHECRTQVTLTFPTVQEGEEAGITIFMNCLHHYEAAVMHKDGVRKLIFRRRIGSLWKIEKEIEYHKDSVTFVLTANRDQYSFFYISDDKEKYLLGSGEVQYLTTEVGGMFTGNYIALYAVGNGQKTKTPAVFEHFIYEPKEISLIP